MNPAEGLADTGALLTLLDQSDHWHDRCVQGFQRLRLPLATSAAVLAELFHLLGHHPRQMREAWRFLRSDAITVLPITEEDLPHLEALMIQYADRPMDFADATLVHLARRESLDLIFTIDHDDFETYRIRGDHPFRIVPGR